MRIRTIKPEFYTHEALFDAELESGLPLRLAYTGLWCAADREGRFKWEPRRLGVQILPYDGIDFSRVLDALATRGFLVKYASDTGIFGVIPSFSRHQVINNKEKASTLPNPSDCKAFDASATREPRVNHACQGEGKGREGNGKGTEQEPLSASGQEVAYPPEIESLWKCFPDTSRARSSKKLLHDAYRKAKGRPDHAELERLVGLWAQSDAWTKDGGQYAPGAHVWIKDRKWECDPPCATAPKTTAVPFVHFRGESHLKPIPGNEYVDPDIDDPIPF